VIGCFDRKKVMLFLPFGLQGRIFQIPWGTLLLLVVSIALSTQNPFFNFTIQTSSPFLQSLVSSFVFENPLQLTTATFLLAMFGIYVELRIGPFFYLLTYIAGGAACFLLKTFALKSFVFSPALFALSTVLSCFLVFFGKANYQALFLIAPKTKKIALIPAWAFLLVSQIFVILSHIFFHHQFQYASLFGYLAGGLLGFVWTEVMFVNKGFLFPVEVTHLMFAKRQTDPLKKIDAILDCLKINPSNMQAMEYLFRSIAKSKVAAHFFTDDQKKIISNLISQVIKGNIKADINLIIYYFSLLPLTWNLSDIGLQDISEGDLDFMEELLEKSEWRLAIRLYDAYLTCDSSDEESRAAVIATIQTTLNEVKRVGIKPQDEEWLSTYIIFHSNSYATSLIKTTFNLNGKRTSGEAA